MIRTDHTIYFDRGNRGKRQARTEKKKSAPAGRVPHVAKLMALAIRLDQLIRDGHVADQAELSRLGHVSRARLTQIITLLSLAPDLQEQILFLRPTEHGRAIVTERDLRLVCATLDWNKQRAAWKELTGSLASKPA